MLRGCSTLLLIMQPSISDAESNGKRLMWIDWMKAIGIYLIVYGHLFSIGHQYVYAFSVPLFYLISGFLFKREESTHMFWTKLWYNLIVPMLIISIINFGINSAIAAVNGNLVASKLYVYPLQIIFGFQGGLGTMWFVYTLIILKIILQFTPERRSLQFVLLVLFLAISIFINHTNLSLMDIELSKTSNAYINTCLAMSFFIIGYWLKTRKESISSKHNIGIEVVALMLCVLLLYPCEKINGPVWMYINDYGNSILLFLLGGLMGTAIVFIISKWLDKYKISYVVDISKGTIVILGFHGLILKWVIRMISPQVSLLDLLYSLLVVLLFIPIIRLTERHFPLIIGKYRIKQNANNNLSD